MNLHEISVESLLGYIVVSGCLGAVAVFSLAQIPGFLNNLRVSGENKSKPDFSPASNPRKSDDDDGEDIIGRILKRHSGK
jgi:hypothetical protein